MTASLQKTESVRDGLREVRFELQCAGERVPGLLFRPEHDEPTPLVLLQHPGTTSSEFVAGTAREWAQAHGWTCAGIDAPLHGRRDTVDPMALFAGRERLAPEVLAQFAAEVSATVDAIAATFAIDLGRLAYAGYSLGSMLGVTAITTDGRFGVAALCLVGEGLMGPATGPESVVPQLDRVAVRLVAKEQDGIVAPPATQALFDALPGEKDLVWLPGGHFQIGPDVAAAAEAWLEERL